jgi:hypothetical protein
MEDLFAVNVFSEPMSIPLPLVLLRRAHDCKYIFVKVLMGTYCVASISSFY